MANDQRRFLATVLKERLQQFCAAACKDATADFHAVVQLRMIYDLHHRVHRSGFRIVGAVDQALDARVHQCSGAHRARFNCSKQLALLQTMVTDGCTGLAQSDDFGMGRGIVVADVAIPSPADDSAAAGDYGSYRDFSGFQGALSAAQGFLHVEFVVDEGEGLRGVASRWSLVVGRHGKLRAEYH